MKMVEMSDADLDTIVAWMVHLRRGEPVDEVKGLLSLDADALAFEDSTPGEAFRLPYADMRSAKRLWGSPVLMVEWSEGRQLRRTAFYFAEPPPMVNTDLSGSGGAPRLASPLRSIRSAKRKQQRRNVNYFATRGGVLRPILKTWASELSARIAASRPRGSG